MSAINTQLNNPRGAIFRGPDYGHVLGQTAVLKWLPLVELTKWIVFVHKRDDRVAISSQ